MRHACAWPGRRKPTRSSSSRRTRRSQSGGLRARNSMTGAPGPWRPSRGSDMSERLVRFVTSFETEQGEIDRLLGLCARRGRDGDAVTAPQLTRQTASRGQSRSLDHGWRTLEFAAVAARAALAGLRSVRRCLRGQAQWFPPMGAASPGEIAQRLRAQGFVLIGPLRRNDTVYLADVNAGAAGHERLVIDAWSGEVLQRFVARPRPGAPGAAGGFVIERGEFDSPPPLAPPPARDFFFGSGGGGVAYGGPPSAPVETAPRTRVNPRSAPIRRKPAEPKPAVTAAPPAQPAAPPRAARVRPPKTIQAELRRPVRPPRPGRPCLEPRRPNRARPPSPRLRRPQPQRPIR